MLAESVKDIFKNTEQKSEELLEILKKYTLGKKFEATLQFFKTHFKMKYFF